MLVTATRMYGIRDKYIEKQTSFVNSSELRVWTDKSMISLVNFF